MLQPGDPWRPFVLPTPEGQRLELSAALELGPVLLAFFKTECPTCQLAMPYLEKFHQAYKAQRLTVYGISQNDAAATREFAREKGDTFAMLLDEPGTYPASVSYGITNVPSLFLLSTDGKVWAATTGWARGEWNELSKTIAGMVRADAVTISTDGDGAPEWKPG